MFKKSSWSPTARGAILLPGKILRGDIGTALPEWGWLYGDPDMWDVITFLRSFVFDYGLVQ